MILNMSIINMSHIFRIVLIITFKKCKVRCLHFQTKEAITVQRAAGTYLTLQFQKVQV
jgi:hypothetical protein